MPSIKTKNLNEKIAEASAQAKENPYLHKILEDEELRDNALAALASVRSAFDRASDKGWDNKADLIHDKKLRKELKKAADGLKQTKEDITAAGGKSAKKRHPLRKLVAIAIIGGVIAVVVNEDIRKTVLDTLFGAEEEFEYTSTTAGSSTNGSS